MASLTDLGERLFAFYYTRAEEPAELTAMRAGLLAQATGRTLEVGAGSGENLAHYPPAVTELVLSEPSRHMLRRLRGRAAGRTIVAAGIDDLPFPDGRFDTVVATFVLCSVPDVGRALAQIARVLAPGGRFLFLEHVRAVDGTRLARMQDLVQRPNRIVGAGCHPNRRTAEMIKASPLRVTSLRSLRNPHSIPWVRPMITGTAIMDGDAG